MIKFEYNGKIYAPSDLDKKLKKLGITRDDIKILEEGESNAQKIAKAMNNINAEEHKEVYYIYWDTKTKGWMDVRESKVKDLDNLWYFSDDKDRWILVGKTVDKTIEEIHREKFLEMCGIK